MEKKYRIKKSLHKEGLGHIQLTKLKNQLNYIYNNHIIVYPTTNQALKFILYVNEVYFRISQRFF